MENNLASKTNAVSQFFRSLLGAAPVIDAPGTVQENGTITFTSNAGYPAQWQMSEDGGKTWSDMSPIEQNYGDRWIRGYHIGVEHHPTESGTSPCYHQYQYKLKDAAATAIEVRATDSFGHVYTQDTFTADNDFTEAEKY